nr:predicted protein [Ipomoea batatas]
MPQRQLDQFTNLSHLFSYSTNIIIANFIKSILILPLHWFPLTEYFSVWSNNTIFPRISFNDLEFHTSHPSSNKEMVSFPQRSICFHKNCVPAEELELLHGGGVHSNDRVIIVNRLVNDKPIRRLLPLQNRCREILLSTFPATREKTQNRIRQSKQNDDRFGVKIPPIRRPRTHQRERNRSGNTADSGGLQQETDDNELDGGDRCYSRLRFAPHQRLQHAMICYLAGE